jgi:O-methyltransferase
MPLRAAVHQQIRRRPDAVRAGARRAVFYLTQRGAVRRGARTVLHFMAERTNYHVVRGMADPRVRSDTRRFSEAAPWTITTDYVRNTTLELVCREVDQLGVQGELAELGVFRGDFAWLMSTYLPGRRVRLFDTFEGFDEEEMRLDADRVEHFVDFSSTDPERVRARFADPDLVELHVGRFPTTAEGIADDVRFAVVSIDADLYAPVLSGLRWFYERLSPGGYLMVHDYNNAAFGGAKRAVREFQQGSGATVIPLPDWGGTGAITRPLR